MKIKWNLLVTGQVTKEKRGEYIINRTIIGLDR